MTESTNLLNIRPLRRRLKEGKEALGMLHIAANDQ